MREEEEEEEENSDRSASELSSSMSSSSLSSSSSLHLAGKLTRPPQPPRRRRRLSAESEAVYSLAQRDSARRRRSPVPTPASFDEDAADSAAAAGTDENLCEIDQSEDERDGLIDGIESDHDLHEDEGNEEDDDNSVAKSDKGFDGDIDDDGNGVRFWRDHPSISEVPSASEVEAIFLIPFLLPSPQQQHQPPAPLRDVRNTFRGCRRRRRIDDGKVKNGSTNSSALVGYDYPPPAEHVRRILERRIERRRDYELAVLALADGRVAAAAAEAAMTLEAESESSAKTEEGVAGGAVVEQEGEGEESTTTAATTVETVHLSGSIGTFEGAENADAFENKGGSCEGGERSDGLEGDNDSDDDDEEEGDEGEDDDDDDDDNDTSTVRQEGGMKTISGESSGEVPSERSHMEKWNQRDTGEEEVHVLAEAHPSIPAKDSDDRDSAEISAFALLSSSSLSSSSSSSSAESTNEAPQFDIFSFRTLFFDEESSSSDPSISPLLASSAVSGRSGGDDGQAEVRRAAVEASSTSFSFSHTIVSVFDVRGGGAGPTVDDRRRRKPTTTTTKKTTKTRGEEEGIMISQPPMEMKTEREMETETKFARTSSSSSDAHQRALAAAHLRRRERQGRMKEQHRTTIEPPPITPRDRLKRAAVHSSTVGKRTGRGSLASARVEGRGDGGEQCSSSFPATTSIIFERKLPNDSSSYLVKSASEPSLKMATLGRCRSVGAKMEWRTEKDRQDKNGSGFHHSGEGNGLEIRKKLADTHDEFEGTGSTPLNRVDNKFEVVESSMLSVKEAQNDHDAQVDINTSPDEEQTTRDQRTGSYSATALKPARVLQQMKTLELRRQRRQFRQKHSRPDRAAKATRQEKPNVVQEERRSSVSSEVSPPPILFTPWGEAAAASAANLRSEDIDIEWLKLDRLLFGSTIGVAGEKGGAELSPHEIWPTESTLHASSAYSLPTDYGFEAGTADGPAEDFVDHSTVLEEIMQQHSSSSAAIDGLSGHGADYSHYGYRDSDDLPDQILASSSSQQQSSGIDSCEETNTVSTLSVSTVSISTGIVSGDAEEPNRGVLSQQSMLRIAEATEPDAFEDGMAHLIEHRYSKAREKFREAVENALAGLGFGHPLVCFAFEKLGEASMELGLVGEAHDCFHLALRSLQSFSDSGDNEFGFEGDFGQPEHGRGDVCHGSYRIRRELAITKAHIYVRLGDVYSMSGQFSHAARCYSKSLMMRIDLFGTDNIDVISSASKAARAHESLASLAARSGDYEMALFNTREALSVSIYLPRGSARVRLFDKSVHGVNVGNGDGLPDPSGTDIAKAVARLALQSRESVDIEGDADIKYFSHVNTIAQLLIRANKEAELCSIVPILDSVAAFHLSQNEIDLSVKCHEEKVRLLLACEYRSKYSTAIADTVYRIGCIFQKAGRHEKAIDQFAKALAMKCDIGTDQEQTCLLHRVIASSFLAIGKYSNALEHYQWYADMCIERQKIDILNIMGILYGKLDNTIEALRCFDSAVQIEFGDSADRNSPTSPLFLINNIKDAFLSPKKFAASESAYDRALDLQDMKMVLLNWGLAQLRRRPSRHAEGFLREIILVLDDGKSPWEVDAVGVFKSMGNMLFRRCRYKEAIDFYEKCLESQGQSKSTSSRKEFSVLSNLSTSYLKIGNHQKSHEIRGEALQELGRSHESMYWEGVTAPLLDSIKVCTDPMENAATKSSFGSTLRFAEETMRRRHIEGIRLCRERRFDEAIESFQSILCSEGVASSGSRLYLLQLYVDISNVYLLKGRIDESQQTLDAAMELTYSETIAKHHPVLGQLRRLYYLHYPSTSASQPRFRLPLVQ